MSGDKRDERDLLPKFDFVRLVADLGGMRPLSRRMLEAGLPGHWQLKTLERRRRQPDLYMGRVLELLHVHRLQGRKINIEDYIVWNPDAPYPPTSNLPQPVPVSQARDSAAT